MSEPSNEQTASQDGASELGIDRPSTVLSNTASQAVGAILKSAAQRPEMTEAAVSAARTLRTLAQTVESVVMPLAAFNYGVAKAKEYFLKNFRQQLDEAAKDIPKDQLREPKPSVVAPALQGLAFSHEEPPLRDLYLKLLATAMDGRTPEDAAHPAFSEILRQLTSQECLYLEMFLAHEALPVAQIKWALSKIQTRGGQSSVVLIRFLTDSRSMDHQPSEIPGLGTMIDNWTRLGLVAVSFMERFSNDKRYDWVEERPELIRARQEHPQEDEIIVGLGVLTRTDFGTSFARAVGILRKPQ